MQNLNTKTKCNCSLLLLIISTFSYQISYSKSLICIARPRHLYKFSVNIKSMFHYQRDKIDIREILPSDIDQTIAKDANLIITIGEESLRSALRLVNSSTPIIASMITKESYKKLCQDVNRTNITALYLDQPLERQIQLITAIAKVRGTPAKIGIMLGENNIALSNDIYNYAKKYGISIYVKKINSSIETPQALKQIVKNCNYILAISDPKVFTKQNAIGMIQTALYNKVPVIGYSYSFVKAGALAANFVNKQQYAQEVSSIALNMIENPGSIPKPRFSNLFSVSINFGISNSIAPEITSEHEVRRQMDNLTYYEN